MRTGPLAAVSMAAALLVPTAAQRPAPQGGAAPAERLQAALADLHAASSLPGATAAVALPDGRVLAFAAGVSDRDAGTPMRTSDRLLSGSVGKTYASAVALLLVEDGKLAIDDPIAKWLGDEPWFGRITHAGRMTVRHLMTHTSGLVRYELNPAFLADLTANPDRVWTPAERLSYLFDAAPPFTPGDGWEYSDTNYIVLGMIVERAGGAPYYEQLRRRILEPHGLENTVPVEGRVVPGLVQGYAGEKNPFGVPDAVLVDGRYAVNPQFEWTGGGLASTAADLARWGRLLYGGHVLRPATLEALLLGVPARLGPETSYGLGVIVRPTPHGAAYGHSGFMPGYQADLMYFPKLGIAVAVQVNSSASKVTGRPLSRYLIDLAEAYSAGAR